MRTTAARVTSGNPDADIQLPALSLDWDLLHATRPDLLKLVGVPALRGAAQTLLALLDAEAARHPAPPPDPPGYGFYSVTKSYLQERYVTIDVVARGAAHADELAGAIADRDDPEHEDGDYWPGVAPGFTELDIRSTGRASARDYRAFLRERGLPDLG